MSIKKTGKTITAVCLTAAVSSHAAILDDFFQKIYSAPARSHHTPEYRSHATSVSNAAQWQTSLQFLGYYHGKIDGDLYTRESFEAIIRFHTDHKEVPTGFLEDEDKRYLFEIYRPVSLNNYLSYQGTNQKKRYQKLQAALAVLSYYHGKIDGYFGKNSKQALKKYKTQINTDILPDRTIESHLVNNAVKKIKKELAEIKEKRFDPAAYEEKIVLYEAFN